MDVRRQRDCHIGHPARWRLIAGAFGLVGHGVALAAGSQPRQPGDQRRLAQTLQVNHRVVTLALQLAQEGAPGCARGRTERRFTPGPQFTRNDALQARAQQRGQHGRKGFFNHPVDLRIGPRRQNVLHHRQGMHHVTERRQLDQKDFHNAPAIAPPGDTRGGLLFTSRGRGTGPAGPQAQRPPFSCKGQRTAEGTRSDKRGGISARLPQHWHRA